MHYCGSNYDLFYYYKNSVTGIIFLRPQPTNGLKIILDIWRFPYPHMTIMYLNDELS